MANPELGLLWANKPGCFLPVAEFWVGRDFLWFVLYIDDMDRRLKIEILPSDSRAVAYELDFAQADHLVQSASRELVAMAEAE
ncbi:hypothetical protein [Paludisphaera soli]|uniref:hypothetical protein n=1 Tax=Paludisphaera soli TaxID=2712865 RepID=UPI0013ECF3DF|nr:hypothetical protein [Paludisphaera soli]